MELETENAAKSENIRANARPFTRSLATWFNVNARDLPWRRTPSLYRTVVSEFMLQQTQVVTVLPYFERWMQQLPDFKTLAGADEGQVLKLWEGLGYYSRARNLHKLAKRWISERHKPQTAGQWLDYPGVGPYTAAAIASIAQGGRAAVVDGNVVRILARLNNDDRRFTGNAEAVKAFVPLAQSLIEQAPNPGAHNEAMMELGATLCTKAKPQCLLCPVREFCHGQKAGLTQTLPRIERRKTVSKTVNRAFCLKDKHLLLYQYPENARRLAHQWELPLLEQINQTPEKHTLLLKKIRGIANERIEERIYEADCKAVSEKPRLQWIPVSDLTQLTLSGPHRRWIANLFANRKCDKPKSNDVRGKPMMT